MLLVAAELMQRVAPTTIFLWLFFVGVWHFLPSYFYSHMHTTKGYIWRGGVPGVLGVKRCFVLEILWNQTTFHSSYVWNSLVISAMTKVHLSRARISPQNAILMDQLIIIEERDSLNGTDVFHVRIFFYQARKYQGPARSHSQAMLLCQSWSCHWNMHKALMSLTGDKVFTRKHYVHTSHTVQFWSIKILFDGSHS